MAVHPIVFVWTDVDITDEHGEVRRVKAMVPLPRYGNVAARQFHEGEEYPLAVLEERSMASHNAYFAQVKEYFDQMPEKIKETWPTPTHLRKWCLMEMNWYDDAVFTFASRRHAKELMTHYRAKDAYARIQLFEVDGGWKVVVRLAKSQDRASMKKADFEASKNDVLDLLATLTDIPVSTMKKEAGRHG